MGVCEKHWPPGCKMHKPPRSKFEVPIDPPSIFPGCTSSMVRQTQPRSTNINKISLTSRKAILDEMDNFNQIDLIRFYDVEIMLSETKERHTKVNCYDLLSFSHCLTRWSQLEAIVKRVCTSGPEIKDEVLSLISQIENT
nr:uncharacterized protein LOC124807270 isoform X2 [Hydra vulgaris]